MKKLITILGSTATGKTSLATQLAYKIHGQIISADSRQVFKHMDIGTGKDLEEYTVNGVEIPHHLIDIKEAGEEYSLFEFLSDYKKAFNKIDQTDDQAILCGGTTLYLDAVLSNYKLTEVPDSYKLPDHYTDLSQPELMQKLSSLKTLHNTSDTLDRDRTMEAIRLALYEKEFSNNTLELPEVEHLVFGIRLPMEEIKRNITLRLKERLKNGMIEEAQHLIELGVSIESLKYYGLEYKFLAEFLEKEITYNDLFQKLNSAIHKFAKKQMTKYRKMESEGIQINWIDGNLSTEAKLEIFRSKGMLFKR